MNNVHAKIMSHQTWVYVIDWFVFAYLFVSILQFDAGNQNNLLISGLYLIEFGVHEVSHIVTMFLPGIFVAAAGSIGEISFVGLMLFAALKAKSYFAACFVGLWLMLALKSVGNYMSDARAQQLPLIGPGETVQHDWNYVFGQIGWLNVDTAIGGTVQGVGIVIGAGSLLAAAYLIYVKIVRRA